MAFGELKTPTRRALEEVIGYLNFSSGLPDAKFAAALNSLFAHFEAAACRRAGNKGRAAQRPNGTEPTWLSVRRLLDDALVHLHKHAKAFAQVDQARAVLPLIFDALLPAYREFHRDLLFNQDDNSLFRPFFIARVAEAILQAGKPWDERERIVTAALRRLNDFVGHRPLAVLEGDRRLQTYAHERVRPVPLWIRDAGAAVGPYRELIEAALEIIARTDPGLLREARFDPDLLDELAMDPRAYDFDHPVNKRPNYHFGQWDPHVIDGQGFYRRYVLQQVTLEGIIDRVNNRGRLPKKEILTEAAAVLAGTILMGSGISGDCPEAYDSHTSLMTLLPRIAAYRDEFYNRLFDGLDDRHAARLRKEARLLHQPLAAARQHLNQWLANRRAMQLQHVHLAKLFARMGYARAAGKQASVVPVASARMACEICCRLTAANQQIDQQRLAQAAALLDEIEELLHRGIECGAFIDPWNILGFGAQFSLFPAVENSVHDHRADELIELVEEIFALYARLEKEAAAAGLIELRKRLADRFSAAADWWDQFATTEVSSVDGFSGHQACESAEHVAVALGAWSQGGTAAGDVAFWREHVDKFKSPKAYALVIEALLDHDDQIASMSLLMQWLSQAEEIPLAEGNYVFYDLALRWMEDLCQLPGTKNGTATAATAGAGKADKAGQVDRTDKANKTAESPGLAAKPSGSGRDPASETQSRREKTSTCGIDLSQRWPLARKFMDYIEAGGEARAEVPTLDVFSPLPEDAQSTGEDEDQQQPGGLFQAAYENVVYRDSTDDGFDGEIFDAAGPRFDSTNDEATDFELLQESERIYERLDFISMSVQLWKLAAGLAKETRQADSHAMEIPGFADHRDVIAAWVARMCDFHTKLLRLLETAHRYHIDPPGEGSDALAEFDRRQGIKAMLLERIIDTTVETADAIIMVVALSDLHMPALTDSSWERSAAEVLRAVAAADVDAVAKLWPDFLDILAEETLLYMPIARGGKPQLIAASRGLGQVIRRLLVALPALGMLRETFELIATIQIMERDHPVGPGGITEFDRMFALGYKAIANAVIFASKTSPKPPSSRVRPNKADVELVKCLEQATEPLLYRWLGHSRNIRLSVLETVASPRDWQPFEQFIKDYGQDLFSQQYMGYGNLRAILHQGVDAYLEWLEQRPDARDEHRLLADLDGHLPREKAVFYLGVAIESVVENYTVYMDYNSTTTQSDRGEMLYTLLDFLRLTANYDRVAWNLRPLFIAHEALVESGRDGAAALWRGAVAERTAEIADEHLKRLSKLNSRHGMRLPSVADRLGERFVRPLVIDRLRSLVAPAVKERLAGNKTPSFDLLEAEISKLTEQPSGVGFEVPSWLDSLEEEAARAIVSGPEEDDILHPYPAWPKIRLTLKSVQRQIDQWDEEYE